MPVEALEVEGLRTAGEAEWKCRHVAVKSVRRTSADARGSLGPTMMEEQHTVVELPEYTGLKRQPERLGREPREGWVGCLEECLQGWIKMDLSCGAVEVVLVEAPSAGYTMV